MHHERRDHLVHPEAGRQRQNPQLAHGGRQQFRPTPTGCNPNCREPSSPSSNYATPGLCETREKEAARVTRAPRIAVREEKARAAEIAAQKRVESKKSSRSSRAVSIPSRRPVRRWTLRRNHARRAACALPQRRTWFAARVADRAGSPSDWMTCFRYAATSVAMFSASGPLLRCNCTIRSRMLGRTSADSRSLRSPLPAAGDPGFKRSRFLAAER